LYTGFFGVLIGPVGVAFPLLDRLVCGFFQVSEFLDASDSILSSVQGLKSLFGGVDVASVDFLGVLDGFASFLKAFVSVPGFLLFL